MLESDHRAHALAVQLRKLHAAIHLDRPDAVRQGRRGDALCTELCHGETDGHGGDAGERGTQERRVAEKRRRGDHDTGQAHAERHHTGRLVGAREIEADTCGQRDR